MLRSGDLCSVSSGPSKSGPRNLFLDSFHGSRAHGQKRQAQQLAGSTVLTPERLQHLPKAHPAESSQRGRGLGHSDLECALQVCPPAPSRGVPCPGHSQAGSRHAAKHVTLGRSTGARYPDPAGWLFLSCDTRRLGGGGVLPGGRGATPLCAAWCLRLAVSHLRGTARARLCSRPGRCDRATPSVLLGAATPGKGRRGRLGGVRGGREEEGVPGADPRKRRAGPGEAGGQHGPGQPPPWGEKGEVKRPPPSHSSESEQGCAPALVLTAPFFVPGAPGDHARAAAGRVTPSWGPGQGCRGHGPPSAVTPPLSCRAGLHHDGRVGTWQVPERRPVPGVRPPGSGAAEAQREGPGPGQGAGRAASASGPPPGL